MSLNVSELLGGSTSSSSTGLQPNRFRLQMGVGGQGAASGGTPGTPPVGRAAPLGFGPGSETLAAQVPNMGVMPTPAAKPQAADPWASMGPFGQFFAMIDQKMTESGMPSLAGNKALMDALGNAAHRQRLTGVES